MAFKGLRPSQMYTQAKLRPHIKAYCESTVRVGEKGSRYVSGIYSCNWRRKKPVRKVVCQVLIKMYNCSLILFVPGSELDLGQQWQYNFIMPLRICRPSEIMMMPLKTPERSNKKSTFCCSSLAKHYTEKVILTGHGYFGSVVYLSI